MTTAIATPAAVGVRASERALGNTQDGPRAAWQKYRAYRSSVAELAALTDRQLADVGIARSAIRTHARAAVFGK